jgi:hypothetical protein
MLSDVLTTPILAIAIDDLNNTYNDAVNAISEAAPDISESDIIQSIDNASQWALSDVNEKFTRLFIPITDKLLPIHYTSGDTNFGKSVGRDGEGNPVISSGGSTVSLKFEIKNSLSQLSTISDILHGLVIKTSKQQGTQPRVSFYGGSICVFNAYLIGVSRAMVSDSQKEVISLTLEVAGNKPKDEDKADKDKVDDQFDIGEGIDPSINTIENGVTEVTALNPAYEWYNLITQEAFFAQPVPDYESLTTIRKKDYFVFRTHSYSNTGLRQMVGFRYNKKYLTMEIEQGENYSVDQAFGVAALGGIFFIGFKL